MPGSTVIVTGRGRKTSKERNEQHHGSQRWEVNDKELCPGRSWECPIWTGGSQSGMILPTPGHISSCLKTVLVATAGDREGLLVSSGLRPRSCFISYNTQHSPHNQYPAPNVNSARMKNSVPDKEDSFKEREQQETGRNQKES